MAARADGKEGEWEVVQRRRNKKNAQQLKQVTTFFFRNFPDECTEVRLRQKFGEVGKVSDVFIPAKRDRNGRRFGFVRFEGVKRSNVMLEKLNKIWVDSYVIRAFIPRFSRTMETKNWKKEKRLDLRNNGGAVATREVTEQREEDRTKREIIPSHSHNRGGSNPEDGRKR